MKKYRRRRKEEFSKRLLIQESLLIWIMTLSLIILAFVCIIKEAYAELPWLTAMVALPWGAYGTSQAFYYNKAKKENTAGGIKYEAVMKELDDNDNIMG